MNRTLRIGLATLLVASGAGALVLTTRTDEAPPPADATGGAVLPVEAREIALQDGYEVRESYAGRVVSRRTSELGFERAGRLEAVRVDEGDRVEAGDLLAELDTRALRAERTRVQAEIREIGAQLEMARRTTERRRALRASDHASPEALDQAVFAEAALVAREAAARAALERVDAELALSEIRAPYAGSITARLADEGTVVPPGQAILRLIEDGALEVHVGIPPAAAAALAPGSTHALEVEGRTHEAVLDAVVEAVDRDTRTVTAIFQLPPDAEGARDGALARIALPRRHEGEGFWLPLAALAESHRGLWSAYALVPDGSGPDAALRADRRQLEVIHTEADRAFVRGTLRDGEIVVWSGAHRLVPGQRVRRLDAAGGGEPAAASSGSGSSRAAPEATLPALSAATAGR